MPYSTYTGKITAPNYYYYINKRGKIKRARWRNNLLDYERYYFGNVFGSEELAEKGTDRISKKIQRVIDQFK